jgi:hypothetical protein
MEKFAGGSIGETGRLVTGVHAQRRVKDKTIIPVNAGIGKPGYEAVRAFVKVVITGKWPLGNGCRIAFKDRVNNSMS